MQFRSSAAIRWGIAAILAASAINALISKGLWQGAAFILVAAAACTPLFQKVTSRLAPVRIHGAVYGVCALSLIFVGLTLYERQQEARAKKEEQRIRAATRERLAKARDAAETHRIAVEAEFAANKLQIVSRSQMLFDAGEHTELQEFLKPYSVIGDPDLARVR